MKTYIVYVKGVEQSELLKAGSHNAAEKKAQRKYGKGEGDTDVSVAYTEV